MQKAICFIITLGMTIFILTGCGDKNQLSARDPVTITIWHNYVEHMGENFRVLMEEFNSTAGAEMGVILEVAAVANTNELNGRLLDAANDIPGAPRLPDIAVIYPRIAVQLAKKDLLVNLEEYFNETELSKYIPQFLEEGRLGGDTLYLLPVHKSTEVLYVNRTIFDRFAADTGVTLEQLGNFEGIIDAARQYYIWTDAKTPDIPLDGKSFYYSDSPFNFAVIGFEQMGTDFLAGNKMNLDREEYVRIWDAFYPLAVRGGIAVFSGYGNHLAMTGDVVCITSTTAGAAFYPDTVTYADNTKEEALFDVLPYPVFADGEKVAVQRGGGMCVFKSDPKREYGAAVFLKWLTEPEHNLDFTARSGYLPVTEEAFAVIMDNSVRHSDNAKIQKTLELTARMQDEYRFYIPPVFEEYDLLQTTYDERIVELARQDRDRYQSLIRGGADPDCAWEQVSTNALERLKSSFPP